MCSLRYDDAFRIVKDLPFDKKQPICREGSSELYILRPSKVSARYKSYDVKKNIQIWLKENEREFKPNHLRVMIDLHLRVRSRPDLKRNLLQVFDNIYYHRDPDDEITKLQKEIGR